LIDFGQTKKLINKERDDFARVVVALGNKADNNEIAEAMRRAGFNSRFDSDDTLAEYAALFFDSDFVHKEKGHATPQHYFQALMAADPLTNIPDSASKSSGRIRPSGAPLHLDSSLHPSTSYGRQSELALPRRRIRYQPSSSDFTQLEAAC
jgi:hypothetical protein